MGGPGDLSAYQQGSLEPEAFGEVAQIRNHAVDNIERVVLLLLGLTLLLAGCSLAVTVGGSLVERKRQFTLLRLGGVATSALRRVILLESVQPLLAASVVTGAAGLGIAVPPVNALLPKVAHPIFPGLMYYATVGTGFAVSVLVILATLPLLNRMTEPANARFE
jgi:predicted lysophospholipase L1 biosynthesis ABC-type transport system permease subunit